jgi:hypothetical protein
VPKDLVVELGEAMASISVRCLCEKAVHEGRAQAYANGSVEVEEAKNLLRMMQTRSDPPFIRLSACAINHENHQ